MICGGADYRLRSCLFNKFDVGNMNWSFRLDNPAILILLAGLGMLLNHTHALDQNLLFPGIDIEYFTDGTFEVTGDDLDLVALVDMCFDSAHGWFKE